MYALSLDIDTEDRGAGAFRIYPIGDLHKDKASFKKDRLRRYIDMIAADPAAVWFGLGDYIDGTTPDHRFFAPGTINKRDMDHIGEYIMYQLDEVETLLAPLRGKPGVMIWGNHDVRGPLRFSGFTKALADRLGAHYGGGECLVRVTAREPGERGKKSSYNWVVYAQHGAGSGMYPGAKLNRMQNSVIIAPRADVYLGAHVHDSLPRKLKVYDITRKGQARLREVAISMLTAPSFNQGRVESVTDYDGAKKLPPTDDGIVYLDCENPGRGSAEKQMTRMECPF